jgi:DNA-binding response OmpR family regulator
MGAEYIGETQVLYVHIRWLREKVEKGSGPSGRIVTVRSIGYKFVSNPGSE